MVHRLHPAVVPCGGSALLALVLCGLLYWESQPRDGLVVYAAASLRPPLELAANDYRHRTGRNVELRFGGSEEILTQLKLSQSVQPADLLLPADDSYNRDVEALIERSQPLASMRAVVLIAPGNPRQIQNWETLIGPGVRLGLAEPDVAAIGSLTRKQLRTTGKWTELERRIVVKTDTVTQSANACKLGSIDATIVWDAVAHQYPELQTLRLPELEGIVARVSVSVLKASRNPASAQDFADYLCDPNRGLVFFRHSGFQGPTP